MSSTADLVRETASVENLAGENDKAKKKSIRQHLEHIKSVITVEPVLAAYVAAAMLCGPALLNLEVEKSCKVNLAYPQEVCDAVLSGYHENYTNENIKVIELVAHMHSWQVPVTSFVPLFLVLILGSYSDKHRLRKPFLLVPLFGELLSLGGCMLSVLFMDSWSLEVQGVLQTVLPSLFGSQTMLVMAAFSYIADVSTLEMRTLRIGIVQIVLNVTVPIVQSLSGHAFAILGYYGVLLCAALLYLLAIIYIIYRINEPRSETKDLYKNCLGELFYPKQAVLNIFDTFKLLYKKSPGNNRVAIVIIFIALFLYAGVANSEGSVFYIYAQSRFSWTPIEYSYFITANTFIHLIGTLIAVPLFTKALHLSDLVIILITFADKVLGNVLFGLANTTTMMYVAAAATIVTGVTPIGIRSQATKIVAESDLGKAQSLFGVCEAIGPAILSPIYNSAIYVNTQATFPQAYFYFGALLMLIGFLSVGWLYINDRRRKPENDQKPDVTPNNEKPTPLSDIQVTHM